MVKGAVEAADKRPLNYNLAGQRLGRKGRDTRERILAATDRLLAGPPDAPISLSAVAREASLAMTTLYLYFNDLTELLLAVLEPIAESAEESHIVHLRNRWPEETLNEHCLVFVEAYYEFWRRHSRILHLRNSFADNHDERMRQNRIDGAWPLIVLLVAQMDIDPAQIADRATPENPAAAASPAFAMATALITGIERIITMSTDASIHLLRANHSPEHVRLVLRSEAKLLELGIRHGRACVRAGEKGWGA